MKRAAHGLLVAAVVLGGVFLRVVRWADWPPGPWIDEAYSVLAARLAAAADAPLFGTTPLEPPDAGFVNLYVPNAYLRVVALVDRAAGGGLASIRALSILPALGLFLAALGLAHEATRERPRAFLPAAVLLATSMWLLTTGRWGWHAVVSSALVTFAAWAGLRASRRGSSLPAAVSGLLLGAAQYGYPAARLALAVPLAALLYAAVRRRPEVARRAAATLAGALLAAGPLFVHLAAHPERAFTRERELSIAGQGPAAAASNLARNIVAYGELFFVRGDENERHGDPGRPIVPAPVAGLLLIGAGLALARPRPERPPALWAAVFLAGGLLATGGANAYRISLAAPFLLILAPLAGVDLVEQLPAGRRRLGGAVFGALIALAALLDVSGFVRWARSPRTWGAFGGPERELADALAAEARAPGVIVLNPRSGARNYHVVEVLLSKPGTGPSIRTLDLTRVPAGTRIARELLYADGGELEAEGRLGALAGRVVTRGADPWGRPFWVLYRIPAAPSR